MTSLDLSSKEQWRRAGGAIKHAAASDVPIRRSSLGFSGFVFWGFGVQGFGVDGVFFRV